jgi:hypothetical protein
MKLRLKITVPAWSAARDALKDTDIAGELDGPALNMLQRLESLEAPPPHNWDGVWRFSQK